MDDFTLVLSVKQRHLVEAQTQTTILTLKAFDLHDAFWPTTNKHRPSNL
jgi:hypothetical protein